MPLSIREREPRIIRKVVGVGLVMLADVIEQSDFLRGLSPEVHERLLALAQLKAYPPGVIFTEGSYHRELHVIATGTVRLEMFVPQRGRVPILTIGPGDLLAWSAVLGHGIMTATAIALEPITVIEFDGAELLRLCETDPNLGFQVMRQFSAALSKRLLATRLQLLDLFAEQTPKNQ